MGLFDFLKPRQGERIDDPMALRERLLDAAASGDTKLLALLCKTNRDTIQNHFAEWQQVPDEVRQDPEAVERYATGMISVAQCFAEQLGEPELIQGLMGPADSNPITQWQTTMEEVGELMAGFGFEDAITQLVESFRQLEGLQGPDASQMRAITIGRLGECFFQSGRPKDAIPHMKEALELSEAGEDREGVRAYVGNLFEIHRYMGQSETASMFCERLAELAAQEGNTKEAERFRKRAAIIREGEPLNRAVVEIEGQIFELDELPAVADVHARVNFERNRLALRPCEGFRNAGEQKGREGAYEEALELFQDARDWDAYDPHPSYQAGFTCMLMGRHADAIEQFLETERLAPGWYYCRSDLWVARQIVSGQLDPAVYGLLQQLEDGPALPDEKAKVAEGLLQRYPAFALGYLQHGMALMKAGREKDAERALRNGLECVEEPNCKTRILFNLGSLVSEPEKRRLWEETVELNGDLTAAAMATVGLKTLDR